MQKNVQDEADKYVKQNHRQRIWQRIVRIMACAVVFCTIYALMLPAATLENGPCNLEEHTHSETCYEKITHESTGALICTHDSLIVHEHTDACYRLVETEPAVLETTIENVHSHTDECYAFQRGELTCQLTETEEHSHEDACYEMISVPVCGMEEGTVIVERETIVETSQPKLELICSEPEEQVHVHSEDCYVKETEEEERLICTKEEHTHDLVCKNDPRADVESEAIWRSSFANVQLTGERDKDLIAIAQSQLGYQESRRNYQVLEDGKTLNGYTRYGDWYGIPYGDWCAMFISFCLNYAGVEGFPMDCNCPRWIETLQQQNLYATASEYIPQMGDIIFFDWDADASSDHVGIVAEYFPEDDQNTARIRCIEGNWGDMVCYTEYNLDNSQIQGYGQLIPERTAISGDEDDDHIALANVVEEESSDAESDSKMISSETMTDSFDAEVSDETLITGTKDVKDLVKGVTVYKKQDDSWVKVTSGGTVTENEDLKFSIDYTVDGMVLSDNVNTLIYKIPGNITKVIDKDGLVYNNSDEEVGSYVIDAETNTISITFMNSYVQDNQLNKAIVGSIFFYGTMESMIPEEKMTEYRPKMSADDTYIVTYTAEQINEVDPIMIMEPQETEELHSKMKYAAYGVNSRQILLRGHQIENGPAYAVGRIVSEAVQIEPALVVPFVAVPMLILLLLIVLLSKYVIEI